MSIQKKTKILKNIFLYLLCFGLFQSYLLANDWELKLKKDGIIIYTRDVPEANFKDSKLFAEINTL